MSLTKLNIIPTTPVYVPLHFQQEMAKSFLLNHYKDNQIELKSNDKIEFIDQGENFESVSCNVCGQNIEINFWQNLMNKAYQNHFHDLSILTRCNHQTSLNDLNYISSAGFAKFAISINNPQTELNIDDINQLQDILGTTLRIVWAHY